MLQSIQAFLETSQATVHDAGNVAPHAAGDVVARKSKRRRRRSAHRSAGGIYADVHAREGGEGEEATVAGASKGQRQMQELT